MKPIVRVSARIVHMPGICCCCGAVPNREYDAIAYRFDRHRLSDTQTKSWRFPICTRCKRHTEFFQQATAKKTKEKLFFAGGIICIIIGLVTLLCVIGIPILLFGMAAFLYYSPNAKKQSRDLERKGQELVEKSCASIDKPVVYVEWNGTVHTFEFASIQYSEAFKRSNSSKLIN